MPQWRRSARNTRQTRTSELIMMDKSALSSLSAEITLLSNEVLTPALSAGNLSSAGNRAAREARLSADVSPCVARALPHLSATHFPAQSGVIISSRQAALDHPPSVSSP